ncbi:MAG: hypothetical protein C4320_01865 [Armatimonadota bacterium]
MPQQLLNGLLLGAIYALVALGYTMVYGILKLINFAHSEVFMMGAYGALFASWAMGFAPSNATPPQGTFLTLGVMLLASMLLCGSLGAIIERFAYRPLRNQPRIASLITAIGLSLLLQYGGQIFLPMNQAISDRANPLSKVNHAQDAGFNDNIIVVLKSGAGNGADLPTLQAAAARAQEAFEEKVKSEKSRFDLSPEGIALRDAAFKAEALVKDAQNAGSKGRIDLTIPKGRLMAMFITFILMAGLTYLVKYTKPGRAMRAVSHDFDAAGLMGVNVDRIVTFTFVLGSVLAGAAAMMIATFYAGTKIDTFFGVTLGIKAFVAAVLGGIGNIPGAVLGGLLMGVTESLVVWLGYDGYKDAVAFLILIIVLILRPGGLLGSAKMEKV